MHAKRISMYFELTLKKILESNSDFLIGIKFPESRNRSENSLISPQYTKDINDNILWSVYTLQL